MKQLIRKPGPLTGQRRQLAIRSACATLSLALCTSLAACNGVNNVIGNIGGPAVEKVSADQPYFASTDLEGYVAKDKEECYVNNVITTKDKVLVVLGVSTYDASAVPGDIVPLGEGSAAAEIAPGGDGTATTTAADETTAAADETAATEETLAPDETAPADDTATTDVYVGDPGDSGTYTYKQYMLGYSFDGKLLFKTDLSSIVDANSNISNIGVDGSGKLFALVNTYDPDSYAQKTLQYQLDETGNPVGDGKELTLPENFYPNSIAYDDAGNMYFSGYSDKPVVYVTDPSGKKVFEASDDSLNMTFYNIGGKMYVDGYNVDDNYKYCFYEIDLKTKKLSKPIDMSFARNTNGTLVSGPSGVYAQTGTGISKLDMEESTSKEIVSWNDCSFERDLYGDNRLVMLSDTSFFLISNVYDQGAQTSQVRMLLLTKAETNPDAGKTIITVGGIGLSYDSTLNKEIYSFNKSNSDYRIITKDYEANVDYSKVEDENDYTKIYSEMINKMNLEILSGDGPDILYGNYSSFSLYESKNLLVDLYTLMEKDDTFKKDDFLSCLFKVCETDGKLYKIGTGFYIYGLVGASSLIGDRSGWTVDEFNKVAKTLPEGMTMLSPYGNAQTGLLDMLMETSMSTFVNPVSNKVTFDSDDFRALMEFAKTNGKDDDAVDDGAYVDDMELIRNKEIAMTNAYIGDPMSYHQQVATFGEPISVVGYPSSAKSGPVCSMNSILAISSESPSIDAAWSFIKSFYTQEAQDQIAANWSIPFLKSSFEKQIQKAIEGSNDNTVVYKESASGEGYDKMSQETATAYRALVDSLTTMASTDYAVQGIIHEEMPAYFNDDKSAEDVSKLIQNRVETIVKERQ